MPNDSSRSVRKTSPLADIHQMRDLTRLLKSIADEHRIQILMLLSEQPEMNVSVIGEALKQSQPAVSHHLTQLRNAGLIDFRRDGKFNYYRLSQDGLIAVFQQLNGGTGQPLSLRLGGITLTVHRAAAESQGTGS